MTFRLCIIVLSPPIAATVAITAQKEEVERNESTRGDYNHTLQEIILNNAYDRKAAKHWRTGLQEIGSRPIGSVRGKSHAKNNLHFGAGVSKNKDPLEELEHNVYNTKALKRFCHRVSVSTSYARTLLKPLWNHPKPFHILRMYSR